ncbi:MAG TPA: hypothetical protein VFG63_16480 [Nocardioidaceae bacterium]|nr:hypothetical protein [Nocardioidaceae bacterium]
MRHTAMRTFGAVLSAATLTLSLAGCGSGTESLDPQTTSAPDVTLFGGCTADDPALDRAEVVAEANIDGVAARNEIAYVPADSDGPCANALFTTFDGEPSAVPLGEAGIDTGSVQVVQLRGTERQLLLVRGEPHPRGGYEVHLFGGTDDEIGEVLADGHPVVGFVATDGGGAPATATCTDAGGIATVTATTHEPPGVILAWDVHRSTYRLRGNRAVLVSSEQIRDAAADPLLRKEMPALFDPDDYFEDCLVS